MRFYYYNTGKPLKYCKSRFIYARTLSLSLPPSLPPSQLLMTDKVQCKITKLPVHTPDVMEKVTDIMATLQSVAQCNLFL